MKSNFKIYITVASAMLLVFVSSAQTFKATYTYDANGNRVTANVIYLSQSNPSPNIVEEDIEVDNDKTLKVNIYPNPTKGNLMIELNGADHEQLAIPSNAIKVWDIQGKLILEINTLSIHNTVDLSSYSNGVFILQLLFKGTVKDYKIIKN